MEIYNVVGQLVMSKTINAGKNTIEMESVLTRIYSVSILDGKGNRTILLQREHLYV